MFVSIWFSIANAAVAVDNVSTVFEFRPTSLTTSHTTSGTQRLMIVGVSILNDAEPDDIAESVTYNDTALNFIGTIERQNNSRVELWSYLNPPAISANVVVIFDQQIELGAGVGIITFTGVDQSSPYGVFQSQTGDSSTASIDVTSASGELVLCVMVAKRQNVNAVTSIGNQHW
ncbi:MAG: hypothetical protein ACI9KN_002367 [Gammaproteobacteria bacterium]|jgi:hypothetical protein